MVTIKVNQGVYKCLMICIKLSIAGILALILAMLFNKYGAPDDDYITWARMMSMILFSISGCSGLIAVLMKTLIEALEALDDILKDLRSEYKNFKNGFRKV